MKTALIVDDSSTVRSIISKILTSFGIGSVQAENGADALQRLREVDDVFLSLVDWNMPVMNGIEFLRHLRSEPGGAKPTVVFCTVENDLEHIREALAAGANEYIMKPFDGDIIASKLVEVGLA